MGDLKNLGLVYYERPQTMSSSQQFIWFKLDICAGNKPQNKSKIGLPYSRKKKHKLNPLLLEQFYVAITSIQALLLNLLFHLSPFYLSPQVLPKSTSFTTVHVFFFLFIIDIYLEWK